MNSQKLLTLLIVAALMSAWAGSLIMKTDTSSSETRGPAELIQGLDPEMVHTIELGKDDDKVVLKRQGNGFVASSKENYPASTKEINSLFTKCLDIKVDELYSSNAKNHEDLGVTEAEAKTIIRFAKADGTPLSGIVVGKSVEQGQGSYVRRVDSNDVYVAGNTPWFSTGANSYLDQELITAESDDIMSISVVAPNDTYTIKRDETDTETVLMQDMPAGMQLQTSNARSVLTAINGLRFDDVSRVADPNAKFDRIYVAALKDSTVYTFKVAKVDDKTFVQVTAEYTGGEVTINPRAKDDEAALKEKEEKLQAQTKAKTFTAKHQGWIYEIPSYKAQYMTKTQLDLLDPAPEPEPADPNVIEAAPAVQDALDAVMQ